MCIPQKLDIYRFAIRNFFRLSVSRVLWSKKLIVYLSDHRRSRFPNINRHIYSDQVVIHIPDNEKVNAAYIFSDFGQKQKKNPRLCVACVCFIAKKGCAHTHTHREQQVRISANYIILKYNLPSRYTHTHAHKKRNTRIHTFTIHIYNMHIYKKEELLAYALHTRVLQTNLL